jgi:anti-sigma factor RsiW
MLHAHDLTTHQCPTEDIAAYIDGELGLARELELDNHFANCDVCARELNQQKQFLLGLNSGLQRERELELPANFTKRVVANAESTVSGLRRPSERFNAIFICTALLLFVLFALGAEAGRVFQGISLIFEQAAIVGGFFGHAIYAAFVGIAIILRSLASQIWIDQSLSITFMAALATACFRISLRVLRIRI